MYVLVKKKGLLDTTLSDAVATIFIPTNKGSELVQV